MTTSIEDVREFVTEWCEVDPRHSTIVADLYATYLLFCESRKSEPRTCRSLGMALTKLGYGIATNGRERKRTGLRVSRPGDAKPPAVSGLIDVPVVDHEGAFIPPEHLSPSAATWAAGVAEEFELEEHHLRILVMAVEMWDRAQAAGAALRDHGMVYLNNRDNPTARPEVQIERDARITFARLLRELALDADVSEPRVPRS